jgi:hypothetical protein
MCRLLATADLWASTVRPPRRGPLVEPVHGADDLFDSGADRDDHPAGVGAPLHLATHRLAQAGQRGALGSAAADIQHDDHADLAVPADREQSGVSKAFHGVHHGVQKADIASLGRHRVEAGAGVTGPDHHR